MRRSNVVVHLLALVLLLSLLHSFSQSAHGRTQTTAAPKQEQTETLPTPVGKDSVGQAQSSGGHEFVKAILHVTSVQSEEAKDWCTAPDSKCSAKRLTVEGYIMTPIASNDDNSVEYVLECIEVVAIEPTPHLTIGCAHAHAHNNYPVRVFDDSIAFEHPFSPLGDAKQFMNYEIVSEKEVIKGKLK